MSKCVADTVHFSDKVVCTFIPIIWNGRLFFDLHVPKAVAPVVLFDWNRNTEIHVHWTSFGECLKGGDLKMQELAYKNVIVFITLKDKGGGWGGKK